MNARNTKLHLSSIALLLLVILEEQRQLSAVTKAEIDALLALANENVALATAGWSVVACG